MRTAESKNKQQPFRRKTDRMAGDVEQINVLQSVNAPVGLFLYYKKLALAQFGDSTKKQLHFRKALNEYIENHKEEFDKAITEWEKLSGAVVDG